jgi:hypothetical protein
MQTVSLKQSASLRMVGFLAVLAMILISFKGGAQTNVIVAYSTTNATPLNLGFAGFAEEMLDTGLEYSNTNFQALVQTLSPGWIRYPSGTSDDAFNWNTGQTDTNWMNTIYAHGDTSPANSCSFTVQPLQGKGGAQFTNFVAMCRNVGGPKIIVVLNCFTDTNTSAGAFAAFALTNHIPVAAWELCNEPYLFQGTNDFFTNGTDYCNKMLPYAQAIKAEDSNANISVFFTDPASGGNSWNNALLRYANSNTQFWNTVSYHYYPTPLTGDTNFADLMAYDNGILFSNTASYVTNYLIPTNPPGTTFMITEFQPVQGSGAGTGNQNPNLPSMTLYGGIYASEFILRMSTVPQMKYVGNFQLFNQNGINATNVNRNAVTTAASGGYTTNTQNLPFGFYFSAQVAAEAVAYWAINRSTAVYATTVSTNGPTVPMNTNYDATMPAIYAQAYQGGNGKRYVVLTNKGSTNVLVKIMQNSLEVTNQFLETFVTGSDPSMTNTSPQASPIYIQSQLTNDPVTIPQYSVVRLEWTATNVPSPTLAVTTAGQMQNLHWAGLTDVVYNLQGVTNLLESWTTLGRVANSTTNFGFTNWNSGPQQFFRLAIP